MEEWRLSYRVNSTSCLRGFQALGTFDVAARSRRSAVAAEVDSAENMTKGRQMIDQVQIAAALLAEAMDDSDH